MKIHLLVENNDNDKKVNGTGRYWSMYEYIIKLQSKKKSKHMALYTKYEVILKNHKYQLTQSDKSSNTKWLC